LLLKIRFARNINPAGHRRHRREREGTQEN